MQNSYIHSALLANLSGIIKRLNTVFKIIYVYDPAFLVNWNSYRKEVDTMLFSPKEKGQGMVEYALIIVLIAIVVIVVLTVLGTQISAVFSQISSALSK